MSLKTYLFAMALGTIMCFVSFGFVITFINPNETGILGFSLFYGSLFFGFVGLFSILIFSIHRRLTNNEVVYAHVGGSFRQAILLSLIIVINMILLQVGELTVVKGAIITVVIILIEAFFHYIGSDE